MNLRAAAIEAGLNPDRAMAAVADQEPDSIEKKSPEKPLEKSPEISYTGKLNSKNV